MIVAAVGDRLAVVVLLEGALDDVGDGFSSIALQSIVIIVGIVTFVQLRSDLGDRAASRVGNFHSLEVLQERIFVVLGAVIGVAGAVYALIFTLLLSDEVRRGAH